MSNITKIFHTVCQRFVDSYLYNPEKNLFLRVEKILFIPSLIIFFIGLFFYMIKFFFFGS